VVGVSGEVVVGNADLSRLSQFLTRNSRK